ncbi:6629_t:CDS:1, partial [Paraglomus occultum]
MNQAIRAKIPIRIKNIQNPDGDGTVIFPDVMSRNESLHGASMTKLFTENGYYSDMTRRHPIAVTIKDNIIVLNIHSHRKIVSHGFFASIFAVLD